MHVRRICALIGTTALALAALTAPAAAKQDGEHGHAAKANDHAAAAAADSAAAAVSPAIAPAAEAAATTSLPDAASDTGVEHARRVCGDPAPGYAACHAHIRTKADGATPDATGGPTGYSAAQIGTAYGLPGANAVATVAVVDAYRHPNALADLNAYRAAMGIPGSANLTEYNQSGQQSGFATGDVGWGQEEMLDLEMVTAVCPACPIIYVGANSASFADLGKAVNTAVSKGATVVSNSYGAPEFRGETTYAGAYDHAGVAITVSSGDSGYGVQVPAAFGTVTAVGGTHLVLSGSTRTESVWSGAGSGCSAYIAKPGWQHDTGCSRRTVADVSAVADPNTGVSVYDSYGSSGGNNWYVFGGTSVAAPIIAGVYALSGHTEGVPAGLAYGNAGALNDVTSGSNGRCTRGKTGPAYICTGVVGYDGPTGMGTPNGTGAF